jgi:hypothetical protein
MKILAHKKYRQVSKFYFILFFKKTPCDIPFQIKRLKKWGSPAFQAQNFNLTIQGEYGIYMDRK